MTDVRDNQAEHRYELTVDGELAVAEYKLDGDTIRFTHTLVPKAIDGQGVGTRLVRAALADARQRGLTVDPQCPFVAHVVNNQGG